MFASASDEVADCACVDAEICCGFTRSNYLCGFIYLGWRSRKVIAKLRRPDGERWVRGISLCEVVLVLAFVSGEDGCYN